MAIVSNNYAYGQGDYKQSLQKYEKFKKGDQKINQIYKPISKTIQTIAPLFGPIGSAIGLGFSIADPIADSVRSAQGNKLAQKVITNKNYAEHRAAPMFDAVEDTGTGGASAIANSLLNGYGTFKGLQDKFKESKANNTAADVSKGLPVGGTDAVIGPGAGGDSKGVLSNIGAGFLSGGKGSEGTGGFGSGLGKTDVGKNPIGATEFKHGGEVASKSTLSKIDTSGYTHGKGGSKEDAQPAKLDGGFVIPAEMVNKFFESGIAEKLGLSKNKPAVQNQEGGSHVKISPGEYYIDEKKVASAKAAGIDLQQFAPNAQQDIDNGSEQSRGTLDRRGTRSLRNMDGVYDADGNRIPADPTKGVYVKVDKQQKTSSEKDPGKEASMFNAISAGVNGLADVGVLAHNLSKSYVPMPKESVIRPDSLPTELNTSYQDEAAKITSNTARTYARNLGVDQTSANASIEANMLEQTAKIGEQKGIFRTSQEAKNIEMQNNYRQGLASTSYKNNMVNRQGADAFSAAKADAIGNGVDNLKTDANNFLSNKLYIDSEKGANSVLGKAVTDVQYKFLNKYAASYTFPQGVNGYTAFMVLQKNNWNEEAALKELGATKK